MNEYSGHLLDMDIERLIIISTFAIMMFLLIYLLNILFNKKYLKDKKHFLFIFLAILSSIACCEVFIRISSAVKNKEICFLYYPFRAFTYNYYTIDYTPPYHIDKKYIASDERNTISIFLQGTYYYKVTQNNIGFRYKIASLGQNRPIIMCIGGSSTWGTNSDGETYPDHLQKFINQENIVDYNVVNLGARSHNTSHFVKDLSKSRILERYKPSIYILYIGHNDTQHYRLFDSYALISESFFDLSNRYFPIKYLLSMRNMAIILNGFKYNQYVVKTMMSDIETTGIDIDLYNESIFKKNLLDLFDIIWNNNEKAKIFLFEENINYIYTNKKMKEKFDENSLNSLYACNNIKLYQLVHYDLLTKSNVMRNISNTNNVIYSNEIEIPQKYFLDNVHLSAKGNEVLAYSIYKILLNNMGK